MPAFKALSGALMMLMLLQLMGIHMSPTLCLITSFSAGPLPPPELCRPCERWPRHTHKQWLHESGLCRVRRLGEKKVCGTWGSQCTGRQGVRACSRTVQAQAPPHLAKEQLIHDDVHVVGAQDLCSCVEVAVV